MKPRDEAKQLILQIVASAGPRGLRGRTRLYKALYLAHLYYFAEAGLPLTRWNLVNMPQGPGIDRGSELVQELRAAQLLKTEPASDGPYKTTVYHLGPKAERRKLVLDLRKRTRSIERAVAYVRARSAATLSEEVHEHSHSWQNTSPGEILDIVLDTMTDEEIAEWSETREKSSRALDSVWHG